MAIVKDYWTKTYSSGTGGWTFKHPRGESFANADAFWRTALHDGFIAGTRRDRRGAGDGADARAADAAAAAAGGSRHAAARRPPQRASTPAARRRLRRRHRRRHRRPLRRGGLEIIFRPDPTIWDGRFANNGWLQELPKPYHQGHVGPDRVDQHAARRRARPARRRHRRADAIAAASMRMPVFVVPGHPAQSVTVFFGYGRTHAGRVGNAVGASQQFNAFLLRTSDAPWFGSGLELDEDRRELSAGDHAGTPRDGGPRAGPHRDARGVHRRSRRSSTSRATRRRAR